MKALCQVKSDRERQTPYNFTYMWNPKNKTKVIDKENRPGVAREEGGVGKIRKVSQ